MWRSRVTHISAATLKEESVDDIQSSNICKSAREGVAVSALILSQVSNFAVNVGEDLQNLSYNVKCSSAGKLLLKAS